jgi:hypothetical protein
MASAPVYNPKESINKFIDRAESYMRNLQQNKYNVVLNFINEWLNINLKSLTEFKNIREITLLKNINHNKTIVEKHISIFNSTFGIELNITKNDIDDLDDGYIIDLLKHVLKLLKLDYKLIKINKNNVIVYTIKKIVD